MCDAGFVGVFCGAVIAGRQSFLCEKFAIYPCIIDMTGPVLRNPGFFIHRDASNGLVDNNNNCNIAIIIVIFLC